MLVVDHAQFKFVGAHLAEALVCRIENRLQILALHKGFDIHMGTRLIAGQAAVKAVYLRKLTGQINVLHHLRRQCLINPFIHHAHLLAPAVGGIGGFQLFFCRSHCVLQYSDIRLFPAGNRFDGSRLHAFILASLALVLFYRFLQGAYLIFPVLLDNGLPLRFVHCLIAAGSFIGFFSCAGGLTLGRQLNVTQLYNRRLALIGLCPGTA